MVLTHQSIFVLFYSRCLWECFAILIYFLVLLSDYSGCDLSLLRCNNSVLCLIIIFGKLSNDIASLFIIFGPSLCILSGLLTFMDLSN
uniref:Uncharacterized protein n=1 Tax=Rhizophora mucronata TaxID=61149 RepID=A0A2P2QUR7_RHIMU